MNDGASATKIVLDTSAWPIVVFRFPSRFDESSWDAHFRDCESLFEMRARYYIVHDLMVTSSIPSARERKIIADFWRSTEEDTRRWCVGSAAAFPNPLVRGALIALTWVAQPGSSVTIHESVRAAFDEAMASMAAEGIHLPDATRQYREQMAL